MNDYLTPQGIHHRTPRTQAVAIGVLPVDHTKNMNPAGMGVCCDPVPPAVTRVAPTFADAPQSPTPFTLR